MDQQQIEEIVRRVVMQLNGSAAGTASVSEQGDYGIYPSLDGAVAAAKEAQRGIRTIALRDDIILAIRRMAKKHARELSEMAVEETGFGRVEDKIAKHLLIAHRTPGTEILAPQAVSGDAGMSLMENAPWGVIASVTPSTNPSCTVINNAISMIAAGNAVVFAPHPAAKKVSQYAIQLVNKASESVGGPVNICTTVATPSLENAQALFTYPGIGLLVVTGGDAVVDAARKVTDKRLIAAGPGNPPVVVDETADLERAAISIVQGASYDNNIVCATEKEIIAVSSVADELKARMCRNGAFEVTPEQAEAIARVVLKGYPGDQPAANPQWVGRDAAKIAAAAGIDVPAETRLLVFDADKSNVFAVTEQMMPIIPLIRAANADQAIDWAVELEKGNRHTAAIHSKNIDVLTRMAFEMDCSLLAKNGPAIAAIGAGGEGWTTMTISTPTGEGVTNALTFTRKRRCTAVDAFRIV
ncbi:Acetaldehyde dehydrogenase, ethanolamine utilization cluster [Photobacterium marinum]|uniref:Acetaldehyde dehydrogenase, ethanolamine utilization cluster n=1 Tax=Photobacterium marinum TaxID=1056511 RepID=L8JK06_9GAMM|nr:aldehyde dehydrogenase family protein [Photobacterium marinum]ELR67742.1 Acetaldehyde dehydrogenase, ethanolamine utilization cluster [Photobacterium marinum]